MDRYKTARILAKTVSVFGWLIAGIGTFFFLFRLIRMDPATWATSVPLLVLVCGGLSLILLSWIARAVFDIASQQASRGA